MDAYGRTKEFEYDAVGRNISVMDSLCNTSTAEYNTLGGITSLTGPMGCNINYTYDNMGRLISETTSAGGVITYGYNALGVKEQVTNAKGQKRNISYDALGRVTGYVSEEDSVSYTYDENGNVLTVRDKNGTVTREYDALNRVTKYTDTFGNTVEYRYDSLGNLIALIYPDETSVVYAYDANNNLVKVTDWAGRVTTYSYDENNRVIGSSKPDGTTTTTSYDNKQRVTYTAEINNCGIVISGFQYTYDGTGLISTETDLAKNQKMWYTYDELKRVTKRRLTTTGGSLIKEERFTYDAAGNIESTNAWYEDQNFVYDSNNKLIEYNGQPVTYDADGNMLSATITCMNRSFEYDSANRLVKADAYRYIYDGEDVRIKSVYYTTETEYVFNTNAKLSQLLQKSTNGVITKYVYGLGLIGEEKFGTFKTYHFDYRGSTTAITDIYGNITDTFSYDTYGNLLSRSGYYTDTPFMYNGRDGVMTDNNGLIHMRARYYCPELRRFINADILHGEISDSTSLNRYSYVNGNPVSFVDPKGYLGIVALMLIGAGIGAVVSGVGSVVGQKAESEAKGEEFDIDYGELVSDTLWGAVDGAISFSPLGLIGKFVGSALASAGNSITNEFIDDEEGINYLRVGKSVALDVGLGMIEFEFLDKINIGKVLKNTNIKISELNLRKNKKWASKQIASLNKDFNELFSLKMYQEMANGFVGITANSIVERIQARIK